MVDRYWVGSGISTSWFDTNNWSDTLAGPSGFSVPTLNDDVYFQSATGNCTLTNNIAFSGLILDNTYTGIFNDGGYNVECYGNMNAWRTLTGKLNSTGTWYFKNSSTSQFGNVNNAMDHVVIESGITLTCSDYFHNRQADVEANVVITGGRYFNIVYPTTQQPLRVHPTANFATGLSFYISAVEIEQSGMTGNVADFYIGYGSANNNRFILTSDMEITGTLTVHGPSSATSEDKARQFDCNGYNLTCADIVLGNSNISYPSGYQGGIKFGGGSHVVSNNIQAHGEYTLGYVDLDTCTLTVGGVFDRNYLTVYHTPMYSSLETAAGSLAITRINKYA